ncbi:hypothetical protein ACA910_003700 [Epithemia clementina (nom. ined.)]
MVDRLAKKFGLDTKPNGGLDGSSLLQDVGSSGGSSSSCDSSPSSVTAPGSKKVSMNDAVTKFLSVAGQDLSAWMMQSMSSSASNAICQQYIDKCMKAELLKLKEANVRLSRKAAAREGKIPPTLINCDCSLSMEEQDTLPFVDFLQPRTATDSPEECGEALDDAVGRKGRIVILQLEEC